MVRPAPAHLSGADMSYDQALLVPGVDAANSGPPAFLANFTGSNGTTLNGLSPDSGPNALVVRSGAWTIQSNRASCGTAGIFTADIARANYTLTCVVRSSHGLGSGVQVIVRYDVTNGYFYQLYVNIGLGAFFRLYRNDGSSTLLASATPALATNTDHTVVVTCSGATITATINGGDQLQVTDATMNQAETHIGARGDSNGNVCLIDSISVPL